MKTHAFRLTKGQDLKESIKKYCIQNNIQAATMLSSVGCLYEVNIRLAGGKDYYTNIKDYEIVSLNGTVSINGIHLHISLSDIEGNMIGGHLENGCFINTTCELILLELEDVIFTREVDCHTGYKELVVKLVEF